MDRREQILVEQRDRVFRLALRLTGGCYAEAEDLTQEALVAALTRLPLFLGKSRITTWLYTITLRTWHAQRERQQRFPVVPLQDQDRPSPDDTMARLQKMDMDAAIRTLPDTLREAFVLVKAEGLTHQEAARILRVPLGTVLWRVREACQRLRPLLLEETDE
jgi:RNA polymerase sigma-70 factor (ECF subfamily)